MNKNSKSIIINEKAKILVIDDEYRIFGLPLKIQFLQKHKNWKISFRDSVEEGIKRIKEWRPDILILDVTFPTEEEGKKVLEFVRKKHKEDIPVIIFTQHEKISKVEEMIERMKLGVDKIVLKKDVFQNMDFTRFISEIEEKLYLYSRFYNKVGILITHGTDTMSFGFSVLKYMLKKYKVNIVLTGAQVPLSGFFSISDAVGNLRTALFVLNRFPPPSISVIFNNGQIVYSGSLSKVRKWHFDAFHGKITARAPNWDLPEEIRTDKRLIPYEDQKLETLYLFRTGGTIEMIKEEGLLKPGGDFVRGYIDVELKKTFMKEQGSDILECEKSFNKDSSCLDFDAWKELAYRIENVLQKVGESCKIEEKFDTSVKVILPTPFYTKKDYKIMFNMVESGAVLLGYGAGNAYTDETNFKGNESNYSILEPLKEAIGNGKIIVISSQVPCEHYDFEYEAGWKLIEAGGIPSGDLSWEEALVRLSYILGHSKLLNQKLDEINRGRTEKISFKKLVEALFVAGLKFRSKESLQKYEQKRKIKVLGKDYLSASNLTFEDAVNEVKKEYPWIDQNETF